MKCLLFVLAFATVGVVIFVSWLEFIKWLSNILL